MKVKAIQIAKELGLSSATVSLALNEKPGVNPETKARIYACRDRLLREEYGLSLPEGRGENGYPDSTDAEEGRQTFTRNGKAGYRISDLNGELPGKEMSEERGTLLVIKAIKGLNIITNAEIDLWTDVLSVFEQEARKKGLMTSVAYVDVRTEQIGQILQICENEEVKGVFLAATELNAEDISAFEQISKPMVIYDNESPDLSHYCVVPDNRKGVERAVEYLFANGYKDIVYLANQTDIYNFAERRYGYADTLMRHNINPYEENRMVSIGKTINEVYRNSLHYLETHKLPKAFLLENYQVTIGFVKALKERNIRIPEQVALIAVDVVPDYMTGDCRLTFVRIPFTDRATLAMNILEREMDMLCPVKSRVLTDCTLVEGDSIIRK